MDGQTTTWLKAQGALGGLLERLAAKLRPFPAPKLADVAINGKLASDPQSYLRLYSIGSEAKTYPTDTRSVQIVLETTHRTPWSDGNNLVVYPGSNLLMRDGEIVSIPGDVADRAANGESLAVGGGLPWALHRCGRRGRPLLGGAVLRMRPRVAPRPVPQAYVSQVEEGLDAYRAFRREQSDFEALFRDHYAEIVRYLAARLGSRDDASELASEVFAEAWRRVPGLQWRGRPVRAWLYRVAANMAADEMRRRARHGPLPGEVAARDDAESVPDRIALARALQSLPPDHQLVVHLRLVEGLPFAEVATIMNRSVGACQMALLRAGKSLRTALAEEGVREHA